MGVESPLEGVRARNSFNLGASLASTQGLGPDNKSFTGISPKSTPERERQFQSGEEHVTSLVG